MKAAQKKAIKDKQIALGYVTEKQRAVLWRYILENDLSVGLFAANELANNGISVLKDTYREGQPD